MKGASKLVVVMVGSVCCCLSLVPPSLAQKPSASARAKSAIQSWETSTQVEVPSDLQSRSSRKPPAWRPAHLQQNRRNQRLRVQPSFT